MKPRILDRLVAWTFLKLFMLFLIAAPALFIVGDWTEHLDNYIDRGLTGMEVAKAYLFELPMYIQWSFPIAGLVAIVFTVHNMTNHREVVAAKAGGISFHRLIWPAFFTGLVLTGLALGFGDYVPRANRIAGKILRDENSRSWRSSFVYVSESGVTWQVTRLTADNGMMSGVVIERPATDRMPAFNVTARTAKWDSIDGWTLEDGYARLLYADSTLREYKFGQMTMVGLDERPQELLETPRKPEEMTYEEIDRMAKVLERTGGNAKQLLVKQKQKLSIPVATLVVMLFGAPLATTTRRGGTAFGIGISLGTTILYMLLFKIAAALGQAGTISPWAAAWVPNLLFFGTGAVLMQKVRT